jgi:release factor glutamine methyltransferase
VPEQLIAAPVLLGAELDAAATALARAGLPEPRREAMRLWAALCGIGSGAVWLQRESTPAPEIATRFHRAVRRRASGVPFAYAAGSAAFRSLELAIDHRALIPRPETEGLVDLVLRWGGDRAGGIAADVGTGSGCIALALAVEGSFERVIATDLSASAAELARENVARISPPVAVEVRVGDLLAPLAGSRCRVIVANPPYLTDDEWTALDPAVRSYEPALALASGADGCSATRRLLEGAREVLEPGGLLALEIDERRAATVRDLAVAEGWHVSVHQDLFGRPRYLLAV